jgi:anaerobic selenocysteine-containing dehydrogenase
VELHPSDALTLGVAEGDCVRVESPRGAIEAPVRLCEIRPGTVFVPFHYAGRAANELTIAAWDLYLMTAECDICWTIVEQAARGIRDEELTALAV